MTDALAAAVIFAAVPLNWFVAVVLVKLAREAGDVPVLRVQAVSWVSLTIIVTVFGLVFLNNGMDDPILDAYQTMILTRSTLFVFSVIPAVYWLRTVWRERRKA